MVKYKIEYDQTACIGAGSCEVANSKLWKLNDEGKADLQGAKLNEETGKFELFIEETDLSINEDAASACPVNVIKITKIED